MDLRRKNVQSALDCVQYITSFPSVKLHYPKRLHFQSVIGFLCSWYRASLKYRISTCK